MGNTGVCDHFFHKNEFVMTLFEIIYVKDHINPISNKLFSPLLNK